MAEIHFKFVWKKYNLKIKGGKNIQREKETEKINLTPGNMS